MPQTRLQRLSKPNLQFFQKGTSLKMMSLFCLGVFWIATD